MAKKKRDRVRELRDAAEILDVAGWVELAAQVRAVARRLEEHPDDPPNDEDDDA